MKMNTTIKALAMSAAALCGLAVTPAMAQNANFNTPGGDVVLFAQKIGGTQTLLLNIGTGQQFRDTTTNLINLKNIGTEMAAISGTAAWWNDAGLFWGVAGVRSSTDSNAAAVNGDPNRTIYTTRERTALGVEGASQSSAWSIGTNSSMSNGSSSIGQMTLRLENPGTTDRLLEATTASFVDNQNLFIGIAPNINPGTAFGIFPGGVMANFEASNAIGAFGGENAESALDLYRILATTTATGIVENGTLRQGQYSGSFVIDQGGDVSFIVQPIPEPTTMGAALVLGCVAGAMRRRRRVIA